MTRFLIVETTEGDVGPITVENLRFGRHELKLARPAQPELLLDLAAVSDAYVKDEYMPYWAALWPVAKHLSSEILGETWRPGLKGIELGCGLGLPGVAALKVGIDMTFSDYDPTALRFAAENARLNGFPTFKLLVLDWRDPPSELYDVIIGSDLTYEERNVEPLVALFQKVLAPKGVVLLADQNRRFGDLLRRTLTASGFVFTESAFSANAAEGYEVPGTIYRIRRG